MRLPNGFPLGRNKVVEKLGKQLPTSLTSRPSPVGAGSWAELPPTCRKS